MTSLLCLGITGCVTSFSLSLAHIPTHSLSHTLTHSLSLYLSLSLSLTHTHSCSLFLSLSLIHTLSLSLSFSLSLFLQPSQWLQGEEGLNRNLLPHSHTHSLSL